jgi:hypothetical protein
VAYLEEPADTHGDARELLLAYLDYFRDAALRKIDGIPGADLRHSRLPSGWTPLSLVTHLAYMERRWVEWGFAAVPVADPWGDDDPVTQLWTTSDDSAAEEVVGRFRAVGRRTRELVGRAELTDRAHTGGRFPPDSPTPTLQWILLHVLQEYARHVGHLDIVRELIDGTTGE